MEKVEFIWNFINKIWNVLCFVLMNMDDMKYEEIDLIGEKLVVDKWILICLNEIIESVICNMDKYEFGEVGCLLYNFIWDDFCDWYIEMVKFLLYGEDEVVKKIICFILVYVLD